MTEKKPARTRACTAAQLKRLAVQQLKQRLENKELSTAELLKVAVMKDPDAPDDAVPRGDWELTLKK